MPINKHALEAELGSLEARFVALADRVRATPETCYEETRSSAAHVAELDHHGFQVTPNAGDPPSSAGPQHRSSHRVLACLPR